MALIVFPDAEAAMVGWVADHTALPVSTRVPNPRPDRFVRVSRTGGPRTGRTLDVAQLTIEVWDLDSVAAATEAATIRAVVYDAAGRSVGGVQFARVEEASGPGNLPDPLSAHDRYTWSVTVGVRATV